MHNHHTTKFEFIKIKSKFLSIDPKKWWGDDFDVRFFLATKLIPVNKKTVLDIGGGIGVIASVLNESNFVINLDISFSDLKKCQQFFPNIQNICSSMNNLPFKKETMGVIICSHLLAGAKAKDLEKNAQIKKNEIYEYPTIEKTLTEIYRCLKENGTFFITASNNEYYKSKKLNYYELKHCLSNYFQKYEIFFFNTLPFINKKYPKLNLSNIIPKLKASIMNHQKVIHSLLKSDNGKNRKSVSFFVEGRK